MTGRRRFWVVNGTLAVVVATLALLGANTVFHKSSAHATVRTVTAGLGNVESTVSASGNVAPDQTENVSFATGGSVTAVDVALGQRVNAGQVLGKLDPGPAQASLAAAQDNLTAAQDNLALAQSGGETPPQQAQDAATISSANQQTATAQAALATAQQQLATDQATCAADPTTAATADPPRSASSTSSAGGTSGTGQSATGQSATGQSATGQSATGSSGNTGCSAVTGDQQAITQNQNAVTQAQESLTQDQLSIEAKRYVNPATILQDQAAVTQAQATVIQDQKVLSETTLTAPFAGTVTALNGAVGQTVSGSGNSAASSSSSSSSTGSATSAAGSGSGGSGSAAGSAGAGSSGSSATGSSASSSSGSSSAFLTLSNMSNLEIVAGFAEADATKIATGQSATVTLSALTGTSIPAKVTAVSPVSTVVSNVVTYDVTVGLTDPPSDVKPGMTANVSVVVASANNVLELPTSAITTAGRLSTVTVLKNGKQTTQTVTTGLAGDTETQIASGLSAGDVVVEPSVTVSGTGTGAATGTGALGGGLFGGGGGLGGGLGGGGGGAGFTRGG